MSMLYACAVGVMFSWWMWSLICCCMVYVVSFPVDLCFSTHKILLVCLLLCFWVLLLLIFLYHNKGWFLHFVAPIQFLHPSVMFVLCFWIGTSQSCFYSNCNCWVCCCLLYEQSELWFGSFSALLSLSVGCCSLVLVVVSCCYATCRLACCLRSCSLHPHQNLQCCWVNIYLTFEHISTTVLHIK